MPATMEVLFLLVLIAVALAVVGGGAWAVAGHLRRKKLSLEGDKVEGAVGARDDGPRPEHVRVENEQRTRFAGTR